MSQTVASWMTADVLTVKPSTPLPEAVQLLVDRKVSGLPVVDDTGEQIRPAKKRTIGGRFATEHDMIAAPGASVAPIKHEFFGTQPRLARFFV